MAVRRRLLLLDRVATLVLALVLLAAGLALVWWWSEVSLGGVRLPDAVDTTAVADVVAMAWFPWLTAIIGLLLALIGLRWLAGHVRRRRVNRLWLEGSDRSGRLDVVASSVLGAAASAYSDDVDVRSARGSVVRDQGQLVARIVATIEPEADLTRLAARADQVSSQLAQVLGRNDLRCTVELHVASR